MNESNTTCNELLEKTAQALDDSALQKLFVSTQKTHLQLCTKYAVERRVALYNKVTAEGRPSGSFSESQQQMARDRKTRQLAAESEAS